MVLDRAFRAVAQMHQIAGGLLIEVLSFVSDAQASADFFERGQRVSQKRRVIGWMESGEAFCEIGECVAGSIINLIAKFEIPRDRPFLRCNFQTPNDLINEFPRVEFFDPVRHGFVIARGMPKTKSPAREKCRPKIAYVNLLHWVVGSFRTLEKGSSYPENLVKEPRERTSRTPCLNPVREPRGGMAAL